MEPRRIRRVRKPTAWQLLVLRWHVWLEETLEKAVCCGVDPATLANAEDMMLSMNGKQASSVFSIRSMSAYRDDSGFEDYTDDHNLSSDTESESTEDHMSDSRATSIDMECRYSFADCDEVERCASVSSDYIPFDDEGMRDESVGDTSVEEMAVAQERAIAHRFHFNCVLAELLMTSHPALLWTERAAQLN